MAGEPTHSGQRLAINNNDYKLREAERLKRIDQILERSEGLIRDSQRRMDSNARNHYVFLGISRVVADLLAAAMDATAADFGNIQLLDSTNHTLRIVAQHGFHKEFLDYFARVTDHDCACGAAMARTSRVTVEDVSSDSVFQGRAKTMVLRAGVTSLQSTPLVDSSGRLIGVLSTHYRRSGLLSERSLHRIDTLTQRYVAQLVRPETLLPNW
jgi:hypothetical protein